jgi:glycogen phosphorylase
VRMLRALGHTSLTRFHMNEGHASLLAIELLEEEKRRASRQEIEDADIERVREQCIFTTHTPVEAGHDKFPMDVATRVIGLSPDMLRHRNILCCGDELNMTYLALNLSHYVNGVAQKHGEISRRMFEGYTIDSITNGVHPATWVAEPFQQLFDRAMPGWRNDSYSLRHVLALPDEDIWSAHTHAKRKFIDHVNREANAGFDVDHLTLGFARRAAPYKRGALPVSDVARLKKIAADIGPIQIVYAGKAHPGDDTGKGIIQRIVQIRDAARPEVSIVYLDNYDMELAALCTSGVDLWLNTPMPPLEASGTSGMKAALNGIPSLSILDGWWVEGCIEGVTGWAIGGMPPVEDDGRDRWESDAAAFYEKLEQVVAPMFYRDRPRYIDVMRHAIALNGSFFNTHRMVQQYITKAYL